MITESVSPIASVTMPGGVWTAKEFVVFDGATTAQLCDSVKRLNKLNLASKWALGDLGIALQERKRVEVNARVAELTSQAEAIDSEEPDAKARKQRLMIEANKLHASRVNEYTNELAEALGVDAGHWWNCVSLARFYPASLRSEALLPEHHIVAMRAARSKNGGAISKGEGVTKDGGAKAREWLLQAEQEGLKASELRRRVNIALATAKPANVEPAHDEYAALTACDEWAIQYRSQVGTHTKEQCVRLLTMLQGVADLLNALRERINETGA